MKLFTRTTPGTGVLLELPQTIFSDHKAVSRRMANTFTLTFASGVLFLGAAWLSAGELSVTIEPVDRVASVGLVRRFAADGTLLQPVDPKAKFEAPHRDAVAERVPATFGDLQDGTYDLIVFLKDGTRLEGFYIPVFDELEETGGDRFSHPPPEDAEAEIRKQIKASRHYENKVTPLFLRGDDDQVRVMMQLLRDDPTSFDAEFGAPVATVRYELWQFTNRFGTWSRDRKSKVLHRVLESKDRLRKRRWLWTSELGGIRIANEMPRQKASYRLPERLNDLPGLQPD
jgi:hypothetical protein